METSVENEFIDFGNTMQTFVMLNRLFFEKINLKENSLSKAQVIILLALLNHKKLTMTRIADITSTSKEQASRSVSSLVEHGYVKRVYDENNRRIVMIELTDHGKDFFIKGKESIRKQMEERFSVLNADEKDELHKSIESCVRILQKVIPTK